MPVRIRRAQAKSHGSDSVGSDENYSINQFVHDCRSGRSPVGEPAKPSSVWRGELGHARRLGRTTSTVPYPESEK